MRIAWLLCCVVGVAPPALADPVSFTDAIARAGREAPMVAAGQAAVESARLLVRPAGQLPDLQLALDLEDVPISGANRFRFDRDEMTMLSVGIMQDVPSEASRRARQQVARADANVSGAALDIARLEARVAAATAWLQAFYAEQSVDILLTLADDAAILEQAATASLGAGAGTAEAALSVRLQAARLQDRIANASFETAAARAELERWVGPLGPDRLGPAPPAFVIDAGALRDHLEHHVELAGSSAAVARAEADIEEARAGREADWSWSLMYGRRDPAFGDMISLGVRFKLPIFQSDRQTPTIDARRADLKRVGFERQAVLREHKAMLEARLAEHAQLAARLTRARDVVLPLARQQEAVASGAHQAGTLDLAGLFAMRLEVKEAELNRLDVERRLALVGAYLTLEYGEALS